MPGSTTTSRGSSRGDGGFIYVPLKDTFYPKWIITIDGDDGTTYYIADNVDGSASRNYLINAQITRPVTNSLGRFVVRFANPDGVFTGKFNGGEVVNIYADYVDATTLQFRGRIDDVKNGVNAGEGFYIEVDGRDYPAINDRSVTGRAVSSQADVSLCDLFDIYFSDITLAFWNGSTWAEATFDNVSRQVTWSDTVTTFPSELLVYSYQNKKGWSVVKEICERVGLGCYMYYETGHAHWTLRTFVKNSIKNDTVSANYGVNMISCDEYGVDNSGKKNLVTVYGKQESSNIVVMASEEDTTSQSDLWIKEKIVNDSGSATMDEVREKAEYELSNGVEVIINGSVRVVGMNEISPGEQIMVSVPIMQVSGYHTVGSFTHNISGSGFTTTLQLTKQLDSIADMFREKLNIEDEARAFINLNRMKDSYTIYFDEDPSVIDIHSDTEEVDGKLQLTSTKTTGIATSAVHVADYDVTECEFRKYSNFPVDEGDTYEVTNDNGITWETYDISSGETHTFSSTGNELRIRISLIRNSTDDATPSYESICLLYK